MAWLQRVVKLKKKARGCHLVTDEVLAMLPEVGNYQVGLAHFFLQHTSASLTLNENYDSDVRLDMEDSLNRLVPESSKLYRHSMEGPDDMPAHVKCSLFGPQLTIPISHGKLMLGTWQGLYLCEHRDHASPRKIVVTMQGQLSASSTGTAAASGGGAGGGSGAKAR